jgi:CRISPR-associated RAMP protein (TIGR02581 family)
MFDRFINHLRIDATLIVETGLHIGAGEDSFKPTEPNGSVLKDVNEQPYIPGSTLKGDLRSYFASVQGEPVESDIVKELGKKTDRDAWKEKNKSDNKELALAQHIEKASTMTERLFGSPLMAGKVKLSDALPKTGEKVQTDYRKGVAIDRDTHTVAGKALFDTEFVPSGTAFTFRLDAENLTGDEAEALLQLLDVFASGDISVGGRSRAGLGRVRLVNQTYTLKKRGSGGSLVPEVVPVTRENVVCEIGRTTSS